MIKFNKEAIGKGIKNALGVIASIAIMVLPHLPLDKIVRTIRSNGNVGYGDVIKAITSSYMSSMYMSETIPLIPNNRDSDFYKAIVAIVESDMSSMYKKEAIAELCKTDKESE